MTVKAIAPQAFLTIEEVLVYFKTTPQTIYRLIRSGDLPAVRVGRQWRFRRADLDALAGQQRPFEAHSID